MRPSRFMVILLIASNCGCASLGVRTGAYSDPAAVYPATAVDAGIVSYVVSKPFLAADPMFREDAQEGLIYLFTPAAIVDFPVAVAVDTLLLPYDLYRFLNKEPNQDSFREWKDIAKDKSPNDPFRDESVQE